MEEKDREAWVGETKLYLDENNILYVTTVGEIDDKLALLMRDVVFKYFNRADGKIDAIIDLNKGQKASSTTRNMFKELIEHEKVRKLAFFGMHPVARVLASFVIGVSKKEDMRFFKTKEEALAWLKE